MISHAAQRKTERIRFLIAEIIKRELGNPRFDFVTITNVKVDNKLNAAYVNFSCFDQDEVRTEKELNQAAGVIHKKLFHSLGTKNTPNLIFRFDKGIANLVKIDTILDAHKRNQIKHEET